MNTKHLLRVRYVIASLFVFLLAPSAHAATTPALGAAASFGVLSGTYSNTVGGTTINGDVGYTTGPATSPTINGTDFGSGAPYATAHDTDALSALTALNAQTCDYSFGTATDLGSLPQPLLPGVYCVTGAMSIGSGITLSTTGTYIFRSTGALDTTAGTVMTLNPGIHPGIYPGDIFWTPGGATTLGANSTFAGTVIDNANAITVGANTNWTGRAISLGAGTVATDIDTITVPRPISNIARLFDELPTHVVLRIDGIGFATFVGSGTTIANAADRAKFQYDGHTPVSAQITDAGAEGNVIDAVFLLSDIGTAKSGGSLTIAADAVEDSVGIHNQLLTVLDGSIIDDAAPVLTEVTPVTTPTNNANPSYTFSTSEAGTISWFGAGCNSVTTAAATGTNTIVLDSDGAGAPLPDTGYAGCFLRVTDAAANQTDLELSFFSIDTVPPVSVITPGIKTASSTISDTVIDVTDDSGISINGLSSGSATPANLLCTQASPTSLHCTIDITTSGDFVFDTHDTAGNSAVQVGETGYVIDEERPVIVIQAPTLVSSSTIMDTTIQVTDNLGISSSSVSVSGAATPTSLNCVQTSATQVDCTVQLTTNGELLVNAEDQLGNPAIPETQFGYVIDTTPPAIVITSPTLTSTSTITNTTIRVTDDVAISTSTVMVSGSATPNTLVCTQTSSTQVDCTVHVTASGTLSVNAMDVGGTAAVTASRSGYVVDTMPPVITITSPILTSSSTITNTTIRVTDNFGIASSTLSLSTSTAATSAFSCTQTSSTQVDCSLNVTGSGDLHIGASDSVGNASQISRLGYTIETTPPVIVITSPTLTASSTIVDTTIQVTDNFSIASSTISALGSATPNTLACTQTSSTQVDCTVHVTASGTLTVTATDVAGNTSSTSRAGYVVDTTAPTLVLTAAVSSPTNATSFSVTSTFSESVTGFTLSDITVGNGSSTAFTTSSGSLYTFTVTPLAQGLVTISFATSSVLDLVGNTNTSGTFLTRVFDSLAPSSTIANPIAGTYSSAQSVLLITNDASATIRYTTDGTLPSCSVGTLFTGAISISSSLTLNSIACDLAGNASTVSSDAYTISASGGSTGGGGGGGGGGGVSSSGITAHGYATAPTAPTLPGNVTITFPDAPTAPPAPSPMPSPVFTSSVSDPSNLTQLLVSLGEIQNKPDEALVTPQVTADAKEFALPLTASESLSIRNFVVYGISSATIKLGQGERRAVVRDYMETVHRGDFVWSDIERMTNGQIPLNRNLALERQKVTIALPVFTKLFGHAPNFQSAQENLAWNTLMYRIRFTRNLAKEQGGLNRFRSTFRRTPRTPFEWATVRVMGYVTNA